MLFAAVTAAAREPHWYVEGEVADTLDGRFRMLATVAALVALRLEQLGADGETVSVALTERFIEVMESEHRELGLGDPKLGRTVRKLVGSLARRVEIWRSAAEDPSRWDSAAKDSIYKDGVAPDSLRHSSDRLRTLWAGLQGVGASEIAEGRIGWPTASRTS